MDFLAINYFHGQLRSGLRDALTNAGFTLTRCPSIPHVEYTYVVSHRAVNSASTFTLTVNMLTSTFTVQLESDHFPRMTGSVYIVFMSIMLSKGFTHIGGNGVIDPL